MKLLSCVSLCSYDLGILAACISGVIHKLVSATYAYSFPVSRLHHLSCGVAGGGRQSHLNYDHFLFQVQLSIKKYEEKKQKKHFNKQNDLNVVMMMVIYSEKICHYLFLFIYLFICSEFCHTLK